MRLLIKKDDRLFKFLVLVSSDRDGSLSLMLRRTGQSGEKWSWTSRPEDKQPVEVKFDEPRSREKRITIHPTGRINYHEDDSAIFIEPLTATTSCSWIYGYRIPLIEKLDQHDEPPDEDDLILEIRRLETEAVSVMFFIAPSTLVPSENVIRIAYEQEGFALAVALEFGSLVEAPQGFEKHFISFKPNVGLFATQQITEEQAIIRYHQALAGRKDTMLFPPNGEGFIRLVWDAPMRIAPRFNIELVDQELHVTEADIQRERRSERVMLKFRVREKKSGRIIREPVAFRSIELDSRL